jgi:hypothetical protein
VLERDLIANSSDDGLVGVAPVVSDTRARILQARRDTTTSDSDAAAPEEDGERSVSVYGTDLFQTKSTTRLCWTIPTRT